jgi:hypothetical protein
VYFTHHRTVHLPVISLPASQRYPKDRTSTLPFVLGGVIAVGVIVSKTVQLYIVNISVASQ